MLTQMGYNVENRRTERRREKVNISGKILDFIWISALSAAAVGCIVIIPLYLLLKAVKTTRLFFTKKFKRGRP